MFIDYYYISGQIEDDTWSLDPVYVVSIDASSLPAKETAYVATAKDTNGNVIESKFVLVEDYLRLRKSTVSIDKKVFKVFVPYSISVNSITIQNESLINVRNIQFDGISPTINSFSAPTGVVSSNFTISCDASDSNDEDLYFRFDYSNDDGVAGSWRSISNLKDICSASVDPEKLPSSKSGSNSRVRVIASDGLNNSIAISAPFSVPPKIPSLIIASPMLGSVFLKGAVVEMSVDVENVSDESEIIWTSNLDGDLGEGRRLYYSNFSEGEHLLTAKLVKDGNVVQSKETRVTVSGQKPTILIQQGGVDVDISELECNKVMISALEADSQIRYLEWSMGYDSPTIKVAPEDLPIIFDLTSDATKVFVRIVDEKGAQSLIYKELLRTTSC